MKIYSPTHGYLTVPETPDQNHGPYYTSDPAKAYKWPNTLSAESWLRIYTELNGPNDLEVETE